MKILVVSDSHNNTKAIMRAVSVTGPDMVLHLGDHESDCSIIRENMPQIPVRAVRGNCDRFSNEIEIDEFVCDGVRILMTHGHLYGVKMSTDSLVTTAMYRNADVVLYGHTHIQRADEYYELIAINPGSVGVGAKTYAVLQVEHGEVKYELLSLDMWN